MQHADSPLAVNRRMDLDLDLIKYFLPILYEFLFLPQISFCGIYTLNYRVIPSYDG